MTGPATFDYIVTVHNKEALLARVLQGLDECAGAQARLIVVLDGCTDRSAGIAGEFARANARDVRLLTAPDVHEIRALNVGLREARGGYCVLLQDDVVLQEPRLEGLVVALDAAHDHRLGYVSFRMGADVHATRFLRRAHLALQSRRPRVLLPMVDEGNYAAVPGEPMASTEVGYHQFVPRMVGIKSPVCLTPALRRLEPSLDETLAPYCYDDHDLSLRALKHGLVNGVFPIHFESREEWGGTRLDPDFAASPGHRIRLRNRRRIWRKHGAFIREYLARPGGG